MSSFAVLVVKLDVPPTVSTPESVIEPASVSAVRVPPTVEVPKSKAIWAFVKLASFPAPAAVFSETAPVYEERLFKTMSSPAPVVVKLEVPVAVTTPVSVIPPTSFSIVRPPPKVVVTVPKAKAAPVFVTEILPVAPLVLKSTAPVKRLTLSNVISSLATVVAKLEVPLAVSTPESVIEPASVSAVRVPPTVEVPKSKAIWAFVKLASFPAPAAVFSETAPVYEERLFKTMSSPAPVVVKLEVPVAVTTPVSVIPPTSFSIVRPPPKVVVTVPKAKAAPVFVTEILPVAPLVLKSTAPVKRLTLSNVISSLATVVAKLEVPLAVSTPESVIEPASVSAVRVPPTVEVPKSKAIWAFVKLASFPAPAAVFSETAPVYEERLFKTMSSPAPVVVKLEVPVAVTTPVSVIPPTSFSIVRPPPKVVVTVPKAKAAPVFVTEILPVAPLVLKSTAPVKRLTLSNVISSLATVVAKLEVPLAVSTPESVIEPASVSAVRVPPTVEVPKSKAIWAFVKLASFPAPAAVFSETAPVYEERLFKTMSSPAPVVVKLEVPVAVTTPVSVIPPTSFSIVRPPPKVVVTVPKAKAAPVFVTEILPVAPLVLKSTAPVKRLTLSNVISSLATVVAKLEVPLAVSTPESVIEPASVSAVRVPPTVEVPKSKAIWAFVKLASFPAPAAVFSETAPVYEERLFKTMSSPAPVVVKLEVPVAVTTPVSVIPPTSFSIVRPPPKVVVTVPKAKAAPVFVTEILPVAPLVLKSTAPVKRLTLSNVISSLATVVAKLEVPLAVSTPESVIEPASVSAVRVPPTVEVPKSKAIWAFVKLASFPAPAAVFSETAPVYEERLFKTMSSPAPVVVKLEVPVAVTTPVSVIPPTSFSIVRPPPKVVVTVPKARAAPVFVTEILPVAPLVLKSTAPVKRLKLSNVISSLATVV